MKIPLVRRLPQKTVVVYQNGTKHGSFNPDSYKGRFYQLGVNLKRWFRVYVVIPLILTSFMFISGSVFTYYWAKAQEVKVEYVNKEVVVHELPPILKKIGKCESGNNQNAKHINRGDVGKYGIHLPIWGWTAHEMGYDLYNEWDNEQFAIWLFMNYGSEPWNASKSCWNK